MPEWPAAEILLMMLSGFIANHLLKQNNAESGEKKPLGNKSGESQTAAAHRTRFSIQALSILGALLARIQVELEYASKNQLFLPIRRDSSAIDKATCPICLLSTAATNELEHEQHEQKVRTVCVDCGFCFHNECLRAGTEQDRAFCCDDCLILSQLEHSNEAYAYDLHGDSKNPGDTAAVRQLLLNYLAAASTSGSTSARFAYEFNISMWAADDAKRCTKNLSRRT